LPLLDREVIRIAERMPDRQKASLFRGKLPLRRIARRLQPGMAMPRRKRGFAVPLRDLLGGSWADEASAWLRESGSTLVDGAAAADLVSHTPSRAPDVWALAALIAWERRLSECREVGRSAERQTASSGPRRR
jgi:hypothetical protein